MPKGNLKSAAMVLCLLLVGAVFAAETNVGTKHGTDAISVPLPEGWETETPESIGGLDCFPGNDTIRYYAGATYWARTNIANPDKAFAVKMQPQAYPCVVIGTYLCVQGWNGAHNGVVRVLDDDGVGGLPGTELDTKTFSFPSYQVVGNDSSYVALTSPVTITSGEFYISVSQQAVTTLRWTHDAALDSLLRNYENTSSGTWEVFTGGDLRIAAVVLYDVGIEEGQDRPAVGSCGALRISPNPVAGGVAVLRVPGVQGSRGQVASDSEERAVRRHNVRVFDAAGRCVLSQSAICNLQSAMTLDVRKLTTGVYLVRLDAKGYTAVQKFVVQR